MNHSRPNTRANIRSGSSVRNHESSESGWRAPHRPPFPLDEASIATTVGDHGVRHPNRRAPPHRFVRRRLDTFLPGLFRHLGDPIAVERGLEDTRRTRAISAARCPTRCTWMWSGCPYPPLASYTVSTSAGSSRKTAGEPPGRIVEVGLPEASGWSLVSVPIIPESR